MSIESRVARLERANDPEAACTHRIPILYDGDPEPEPTCGCPRIHTRIVVCYPDGERVPKPEGARATL